VDVTSITYVGTNIDTEILQLKHHVSLDCQYAWNLYLPRIGQCYSDGGIWGDETALKACSDTLR